MKNFSIMTAISMLCALSVIAQDQSGPAGLRADAQLIPDKFLEAVVPLVFVLLFLNLLVEILKHRAETKLKVKMVEAGVSEESLVAIFRESNAILRLQPLKWALFALAGALALITIDLFRESLLRHSGYLPVGIILLFIASALFVYHRVLSKKI